MENKHKLTRGIIQIYTGSGKGKTTAAIGLAARATSHNLRVAFIQFIKSGYDQKAIKSIPYITYRRFGLSPKTKIWLKEIKPGEKPPENHLIAQKQCLKGWHYVQNLIKTDDYDLIILDEINIAIHFRLITLSDIIHTLETKPPNLEIVLTGRYAPKQLINFADLVSEIKETKHPYNQGLPARKGIEY